MVVVRRLAKSFWLSTALLFGACDDASPGSHLEHDGGAVGAQDAGVGDGNTQSAGDASTATPDAAGAMDSGNTVAVDSSAQDANASSMQNDASAVDSTTTPSEAAVGDAASEASSPDAGAFTLTSPALDHAAGCAQNMASRCDVFPEANVAYMKNAASETENISPELSWSGVPAGTKSFAVVLQDLTNGMAHWVLWNIPGTALKLEQNVPKGSAMPATPAGSQQCNANFAMGNGYYGPGSRCNVYEFVLYALSVPMFSPMPAADAGSVRTQLQALGPAILASASLRGRANYMMMCRD